MLIAQCGRMGAPVPEHPTRPFLSPSHFTRAEPPEPAAPDFRPFFRRHTAPQVLPAADRCSICGLPLREDAVKLGLSELAHRACFAAQDRMDEALELEFGGALPGPFSDLSDLELEATSARPRSVA